MTDETPGPDDLRPQTVTRMQAIAAGLQGTGLDASVHDTRGVLDIRASRYNAGSKNTDVTIDEDGYVTVSYWNDPDATPIQIVEIISRMLVAITG